MATFNKVNTFVLDLAEKKHNLSSDVLKVALTNVAPTAASTAWSIGTFTLAGVDGYTAGGNTLSITSSSQTSGTYKLVWGDTTFTSSGTIGPFRYVILSNDTSTTDLMIGYYDYGSSITLASGETFTVDFDPSAGVLTLA
jgi:hypothetical protein